MFNVEEVLSRMTLEEKAQMCSGRDFWKTQDIDRLGVEPVMMCDGPNGLRKQPGAADHLGINKSIETVCYPTASALASSFDRNLLKEEGELLGEECRAEHVGMLLGPGVNMKRSPLCGRNFEYFSEDPYLAGELAAAYIQGLQSKGVAACVKHFAANNQETRRMSGSSDVDERTLHEIYLPAFEKAVKKGKVRSVMCAYNAVNGTFCSENEELLTKTLREEWGFDGFVVTDWGAVKDRVVGLKAGLDLEMPGATEGKTADIVKAVESGDLPMEVLDAAVRNVLRFVAEATEQGLAFEDTSDPFDRSAAREMAYVSSCESAVLLKNDGTLPLPKEAKVAVIGEFAGNPRYQGAGSSHINVVHPVSPMEVLRAGDVGGGQIVYAKGYESESEAADPALTEEAVKAAAAADVAVVFAGLPESFETEGADRESMELPANQNALIEEIRKVQDKVVVVLMGGAPMVLPWRDQVSAVLCMYLGGDQVGRSAVDLLYGEANPSGKLAETWPVRIEDNPSFLNFPGEGGTVEYREGIYIGYRYYDKKKMAVQYPFGHGLSYTTFEYRDLRFDKTEMSDADQLTVTCKVKNTGSRFGREVVQLYAGVPDSAVRRAVRELKGFEKISLTPGEEKEVSFVLDAKDFAYYETKIQGLFVESGHVIIEVGSSSADLRLSGTVTVKSGMEIPMTVTKITTIGELLTTQKGRAFVAQMMGVSPEEAAPSEDSTSQEEKDSMGAGAARMHQQMMMDMPLTALVSYGRMTSEQLDGLIAMLNS